MKRARPTEAIVAGLATISSSPSGSAAPPNESDRVERGVVSLRRRYPICSNVCAEMAPEKRSDSRIRSADRTGTSGIFVCTLRSGLSIGRCLRREVSADRRRAGEVDDVRTALFGIGVLRELNQNGGQHLDIERFPQ